MRRAWHASTTSTRYLECRNRSVSLAAAPRRRLRLSPTPVTGRRSDAVQALNSGKILARVSAVASVVESTCLHYFLGGPGRQLRHIPEAVLAPRAAPKS